MDLRTRQHYLKAFGVQAWYARSPLPGAAPSPVSYIITDDVSPVARRPVAGKSSEKAPPLEPRQTAPLEVPRSSVLDVMRPKDVAEAPAPVASAAVSEEPSTAEEISATVVAIPETRALSVAESTASIAESTEMDVLVHRVGDVLLVGDLSPQFSIEQHQALLDRMFDYLKWDKSDARSMPFSWPPFSNPLLPRQGVEDGQRVFAALLAKWSDTASRVWLMGDGAGRLLALAASQVKQISIGGQQLPVWSTLSLARLMEEPLSRRDLLCQMQVQGIVASDG